ncbi:MAG: DEAD/DEAH box helicase family protein [Fibrobacter sp.]|nr:DEAD/DEAH box helicase family protein [Fibrobacter sp.]
MALFTDEEIRKYAFSAVIDDGRGCYSKGNVSGLHFIGNDIIASVRCDSVKHKVAIRKENNETRFDCSCNFSFGGACEHVVAVMMAANAYQAIQVGIDWDIDESNDENKLARIETNETIAGEPDTKIPDENIEPDPQLIIEIPPQKPIPRLYLSECETMLLVELRFSYYNGDVEFTRLDSNMNRLVPSEDGKFYKIFRSKARETAVTALLAQYELMQYQTGYYTPCCDPRIWTLHELPLLAKEGFEIYGEDDLRSANARKSAPKLSVSINSEENLFDCSLDLSFDGISATLASLIMAVQQRNRFVLLNDGSSGILSQDWLEKFAGLFAAMEIDSSQKTIKIRSTHISLANMLLDMADEQYCDSEFKRKREELYRNFSGLETIPLPETFTARMRPYQIAGYEWFYFLKKHRFGGCLADDMGLGKTVQTLALLLNEKQLGEGQPSIVVVPTSLLFNWQREAQKFAPSLNLLLYHGSGRHRYLDIMHMADVVLTTYGTVLRDIESLERIDFHYVILDEAQAIKNPGSQISSTLRKMNCRYRLALSGTPVENNLSELWSLFSFINPGMLGPYRNFSRNFIKPIEREANEKTAELLRKLIFPFVLRRKKEQVATDLPPKNEITIFAEMLSRQRTFYEIMRETYRGKVIKSINEQGMEQSRFQILEGLLRLRQICCHPDLVDKSMCSDSGKFRLIEELIEEVVSEGHRVLVFSQFVKALELFRTRLSEKNITSEILTGATRDRQSVVERFQKEDGAAVFFISLKAGGTGLNLTCADYVIHVDPWWNPSAENQASDRAYRIGQTKTVFVYKVITKDSIEEQVLKLQEKKRNLTDSVIQTEMSFFKKLTQNDIMELFK